eukprot:6787495-Pyramimonas_sp.AAC.1
MPYWPQELMKSRTCCKMDEDCRALPLDLKERWSQVCPRRRIFAAWTSSSMSGPTWGSCRLNP